MYRQISSIQNQDVKRILLLQEKSRTRRKEGCFVVEGIREIELAHKGGYEIAEIYFCSELLPSEKFSALSSYSSTLTEITTEVYQKVAYRGSTEGVLAVVNAKDLGLNNLQLKSQNPLILIAEAPEKPGNIGALLRTADAANLDAVLIANPKTDMFNPNIIRSSVGCVFTNQIATGSTTEILRYLKEKNIPVYGAALQASVPYYSVDFTSPTAIVVGTEATGLTQEWLENTNQNIIIPMQGEIDSMNLSVAAGILIFEARRQRNFN